MYVFIVTYRSGLVRRFMGATYKHTNDVVNVIKYRSVYTDGGVA